MADAAVEKELFTFTGLRRHGGRFYVARREPDFLRGGGSGAFGSERQAFPPQLTHGFFAYASKGKVFAFRAVRLVGINPLRLPPIKSGRLENSVRIILREPTSVKGDMDVHRPRLPAFGRMKI